MKVLLVLVEYETSGFKHLNLSLLSAILAKRGHERKLFDTSIYNIPVKGRVNDADVTKELLLYPPARLPSTAKKSINKDVIEVFNETLKEYDPDLVAISSTSVSYIIVELLLKSITTKVRPPIAIGGIHALLCTDEIVESGLFDYICLGEGEKAIVDIMDHLAGEKASNEIANTLVKEERTYIKNDQIPLINDLDSLPFHDWTIYDDDYYFFRPYQGKVYRMGDFITSRGCPYTCVYCFYDRYYKFYNVNKKLRFYSPERAVTEIEDKVKRYDLSFLKMHDSDLLLRSERNSGEFIDLYASRVGIPFACNLNANSVTKAKAKALKVGKCVSVTLGIESGSERVRREVLKKNVSNESIAQAVANLKEVGIRVVSNNMIGIPDESEEEMRETLYLNRNVGVDLCETNYFYPFQGTELGDLCYKRGYIKEVPKQLINFRFQYFLDMPQISKETLEGFRRTFQLYSRLPDWLDPIIKLAERADKTGNEVFEALRGIVQKRINESSKNR